jgi:hypothetical protein
LKIYVADKKEVLKKLTQIFHCRKNMLGGLKLGGKYYIPKPSSRIKKCICCVLTIIMLLISNTGFIPNYYITNNAKAISLPNNSQTSIASGNSDNESPSEI